jgi:hypothetical protein
METKREGQDVSWVVAGVGGSGKCERCGDTLSNKLPMAVETFVARLRLFIELHSSCVKFDCGGLPILSIDRFARATMTGPEGTVHINTCGHPIPKKGDLSEEPCGRGKEHQGRHARVPSPKRKEKIVEAQNANDD